MHIRLSQCERIDISHHVQIGQTVVHKAMCGLVTSNGIDHVQELGVRLQTPVVYGDLGSRRIGPDRVEDEVKVKLWGPDRYVPVRKSSSFNFRYATRAVTKSALQNDRDPVRPYYVRTASSSK
jgi:hypothetical protein